MPLNTSIGPGQFRDQTYYHQQGTAYNGYFACTCYHPLFLFNQFGDRECVLLRRGNHPSAEFWRRVLFDLASLSCEHAEYLLPTALPFLLERGQALRQPNVNVGIAGLCGRCIGPGSGGGRLRTQTWHG